MCYQEAALYGDLVLFLRDRAAELLARLYADYGFFAESLEALAQLDALEDRGVVPEAQQLWAEVTWWHDYREQLPWIH